jgi:hypothetical protein
MIYFQRKVKCKFGGDEKYLPKNMSSGKFVPVIGYEIRRREKHFGDDGNGEGKTEVVEDIIFVVIGNDGKFARVAEFNCMIMIDEKAELDALTIAGEICGKLEKAVSNCNVLLKYLSGQAADTDKAVNDVKGNDQG